MATEPEQDTQAGTDLNGWYRWFLNITLAVGGIILAWWAIQWFISRKSILGPRRDDN